LVSFVFRAEVNLTAQCILPAGSHVTICTCYCRFCGCDGLDRGRTTILISLKSIMTADGDMKTWSLRIGIAAILCSSIGTATSALNAFYGPRKAYLKAERSIAALRQLHSDIAIPIGSIREPQSKKECPSFDPANKDDPLYKQVQDWKTKFAAVVTASDSGSSYPSETAVPDQSSSAGPSQ
jgi:hypothetical protein